MRYVAQKEPNGCMVAAVAMVTGCTYDEIREICTAVWGPRGISQPVAHDILAELGFATVTRYRYQPRLGRDRSDWPCAPFAGAHIAQVLVAAGTHAVAMDEHGVVLDPWDSSRKTLTHPAYQKVDYIDGIYFVGR